MPTTVRAGSGPLAAGVATTAGMPATVRRTSGSVGRDCRLASIFTSALGSGFGSGADLGVTFLAARVEAPLLDGACGAGGTRAMRSPGCALGDAVIGAPHSPQKTTGPVHSVPHAWHFTLGTLTRVALPGAGGRRHVRHDIANRTDDQATFFDAMRDGHRRRMLRSSFDMIPSRFVNLDAARARFGDRVDRLAPYLTAVDPLADAVVEAFAALPRGRGFAMVEEALARGIDAVPGAPEPLRALFAEIDRVPPWVDWEALDRGGELLLRAGVLGGMVLGAGSIVLGYASPGGNKPLVLSGRLQEQASRRLNETARFVQAVCRPGGMRRSGDGFHISTKVRLMHAQVRRMILASGRWDAAQWGAPINQHDMSATTLLFSLAVVDGAQKLGLDVGQEEGERYTQLWRYVGWVMGCDRELTPASLLEGRQLAELIQATQGPPDHDSRALTVAALNAPLTAAKTPAERRWARVQKEVGKALIRGLLGDAMADQLDVPRSKIVGLVPLLRNIAAAAEPVRKRLPAAHRAAVQAGSRYWDRVIEIGLAGATAEFRPPERLSRAA